MAARKNCRLKLKYASRLRPLADFPTEIGNHTKEMIMASVSEHASQSPPRSAPDSMPSPYDYGNPSSLPSQQQLSHPVPPMTASSATQRRRKTPKHSLSSLKRSASTPNVRGDAGMSMADKRRNKLGYHRTSVACGTCPAPDVTRDLLNVVVQQDIAEGARFAVCWPPTTPRIVAPTAFGSRRSVISSPWISSRRWSDDRGRPREREPGTFRTRLRRLRR